MNIHKIAIIFFILILINECTFYTIASTDYTIIDKDSNDGTLIDRHRFIVDDNGKNKVIKISSYNTYLEYNVGDVYTNYYFKHHDTKQWSIIEKYKKLMGI